MSLNTVRRARNESLWSAGEAGCLHDMWSEENIKWLKGQRTKIVKQHIFHVPNHKWCSIPVQWSEPRKHSSDEDCVGTSTTAVHTSLINGTPFSFFHLAIPVFSRSPSPGTGFSFLSFACPCFGCRCPSSFYGSSITRSYEIPHLTFEGYE